MLTIDWEKNSGWGKPKIVPYGPIKVEATNTSLHYGISAIEGISSVLNATTKKPQAFRLPEHIDSFSAAGRHLDLPGFDKNELAACVKKLNEVDQDWYIKSDHPSQMYTRLCHFSTDNTLGIKTANSSKLMAILSPNTLRYKERKVKCATGITKSWPKGHGAFRIGGNFGPLIPISLDSR